MFKNIKKYQQNIPQIITTLQDVRTLGLMAFLVITLMISWSGIKIIETNYKIQKDIAALQQQNSINKLENKNLELRNKYYQSEEYLELEARKNFGLAAPGEKVIVVPKGVALRYTVEDDNIKNETTNEDQTKKPGNFESWMDFLMHRGRSI